jgi:hypothetical protein
LLVGSKSNVVTSSDPGFTKIQVAELRRGIAETLETCFMLTRLEGVDVRDLVMGATIEECAMYQYSGLRVGG